MKEVSPFGVYIKCYSHRLNLALQSILGYLEPLRKAFGTTQSIYNFLEESTKHEVFLERIQKEYVSKQDTTQAEVLESCQLVISFDGIIFL